MALKKVGTSKRGRVINLAPNSNPARINPTIPYEWKNGRMQMYVSWCVPIHTRAIVEKIRLLLLLLLLFIYFEDFGMYTDGCRYYLWPVDYLSPRGECIA